LTSASTIGLPHTYVLGRSKCRGEVIFRYLEVCWVLGGRLEYAQSYCECFSAKQVLALNEISVTDESLVRLVRSGDEAAAATLYERYSRRVAGLVKQQMSDYLQARMEPEDIVQSVFRSVFRGVHQANYDAPEGGTLWHLIGVLAVHKVRRNARKQTAAKRDVRRTQAFAATDETEVRAPSAQEFELAVRECIEHLTDSEQLVLKLRIEGHTVEEIAEKTNKSRRTVERLLQAARSELARLLSED
jgi:RNA polymerase sigma-70 factor, ECF subfamily